MLTNVFLTFSRIKKFLLKYDERSGESAQLITNDKL